MNKTKRLALEAIMLSMDAIKVDIECHADDQENLRRSEAMKNLAEAYKIISKA